MTASSLPWSTPRRLARSGILLASTIIASACSDDPGSTAERPVVACDGDTGITLPEGFCATVFADGIGRARHLAVTLSGDVFVAVLEAPDGGPGHVMALRDGDGDGVAEIEEKLGDRGVNGIAWRNNVLYVAADDRIVRYTLPDGELRPADGPLTVVSGLPIGGDHERKSLTFDAYGHLLVNFGSATDVCQVSNREPLSPGIDPCPELDYRAGIWSFDGRAIGQTPADGYRYATGIRNANAIAMDPRTRDIWVAQQGRDSLATYWPLLYPPEANARLPAEELFRVIEGTDHGWPYCYYDAEHERKVLGPEYGGNGHVVGRCYAAAEPELVLPAHWAPLSMRFYQGDQFPEHYRGGLFVANHGSWHQPSATKPPGYNVTFFPRDDDDLDRRYETFADGFAGDDRPLPEAARHRPVGLAEAPDGSLYISDDQGGRIWRVYYRGPR
ncbi:PQQ-dependent sugar dehydrogenase [Paraliomyxa miuraensis]|uniref:PQQ-dependent sugar dehydrogenase n=1 Tax=Paraliomyxa miuraensis TaxID=376150 RepID=UPI00224EED97|nr:PQQ-dependent sugar dehydrogenase [Paraliomyxa miuraensis]MCX4247055.1 PQQ-dependent sugar dehydrogenase [Paraliomyxa miuraensis]